MKIALLQEHLAEALGIVGRVVPAKSTLPVLGNVLLATDQDGLVLSATNLDLSIKYRVQASVGQQGSTTLPSRLLADYVALLDHGQTVNLDVDTKKQKTHLVCGRYEANISGIDAEDFPPIPTVSGGATLSLPSGTLRTAIEQVVFAAAADDSRPVLAGVLVRVEKASLTLAAADGFRLAVRTVDLPDGGPEFQVIVPAKALAEVARLLPTSDEQAVQFSTSKDGNQVHVAFGSVEITSRLIEGQFPDYNRIIPPDGKTTVTTSTTDLLRATRAAAVFARDNSNIVRLDCTPANDGDEVAVGSVMVRSTSAEMGDNQGRVDAVVEGAEGGVAFNGRYLRDALEAMATSQVKLQVNGPSSPGVLRPVGADADPFLCVIMPMHVAR